MIDVIMTSSGLTLLFALVAILAAWGMLRWLDVIAGVNFKTTIREVCRNEHSAALYFGLRFLGVCILLGLVLS